MADQRLIPAGIFDESTQAFNELIERLGTLDLSPLEVYRIDSVVESALPLLAEQFHVAGIEGWGLTRTAADRRALIQQAIDLHRDKGTKQAVMDALVLLGINPELREWFEYAGAPYTFKVAFDLDGREIDLPFIELVEATINAWKNARSHLTLLSIYIKSQGKTPRVGCVLLTGELITVYPFQVRTIEVNNATPRYRGVTYDVDYTTVYPLLT